MFKTARILVVAALCLLTTNAHAAFITDGDFAHPNGGNTFTTYGTGSSFGPWHVDRGNVDLIGNYWAAPTVHGGSVDMNGDTAGTISQGAATAIGQYLLTFSLSGNPYAGAGSTFGLRVSVGDQTHDYTFTVSPTQTTGTMQYVSESLLFNTTGATTLSFSSLTSSGVFGPVIGGVSISAVPLPASVYAMIAALLAMAGLHQLRKHRAA